MEIDVLTEFRFFVFFALLGPIRQFALLYFWWGSLVCFVLEITFERNGHKNDKDNGGWLRWPRIIKWQAMGCMHPMAPVMQHPMKHHH